MTLNDEMHLSHMARLKRAEATIRALTRRLDLLEGHAEPKPAETPPDGMAEVVAIVAAQYGLRAAHLVGPSKYRRYIPARFEAYRRLRDAGFSYGQIGRYFGRDHSTVMHGVAKAEKSEALPRTGAGLAMEASDG